MMNEENINPFLTTLKSQLGKEYTDLYTQPPVGYFENLDKTILNKLYDDPQQELANYPLLASVTKEMPYKKEMSSFDLEKVAFFHGIDTPYKTPEHYFEKFENSVLKTINSKPKAKTILLKSKWYQIAAAAILVAFISINIYQNENNSEILITQHDDSISVMKNIGNNELDSFIDDSDPLISHVATANIDKTDFFKDINTQDLKKFLTETGDN